MNRTQQKPKNIIQFNMSSSEISYNLHGTIRPDNYDQAVEDTNKYGPMRVELSLHLRKILTELGLVWCLDGGTLLGAHRDGFMLPHDDDFDLLVYNPWLETDSPNFEKECHQVLQKLQRMIAARLPEPYKARVVTTYAKKVEVYNPKEGRYAFRDTEFPGCDYHNVTCDLTLLLQSPVYPEILLFQHSDLPYQRIRRRPFFPFSKILYEGNMYNAPGDPKAYLEDRYGYIGKGGIFNKGSGFYEQRIGGDGVPNNWQTWVWSPICNFCDSEVYGLNQENNSAEDKSGGSVQSSKCACTCVTCGNVHDTRDCECQRKLVARHEENIKTPKKQQSEMSSPLWAERPLCQLCEERERDKEFLASLSSGGDVSYTCICCTCTNEEDDRACECVRKREARILLEKVRKNRDTVCKMNCHCGLGRLGHPSWICISWPLRARLEELGQNWEILIQHEDQRQGKEVHAAKTPQT